MEFFTISFICLVIILSIIVNFRKVPEKIRACKSYFGYFYLFLITALTAYSTYLTYSQFFLWKNSELGKNLLPPYTPIIYFITYAFYRFWAHFLAALIFSLAILLLAIYFNKKRGGIHFYEEEPYYIAIAILAVGYPGWLVYFSLMLLVPLLWSVAFVVWVWLKKFFELGIRNKELGGNGRELGIRNKELGNVSKNYYLPRISYYYLWLGLALGAILINKWLATFNWWTKLII